jgi:hypothetical protein
MKMEVENDRNQYVKLVKEDLEEKIKVKNQELHNKYEPIIST